MAQPLTEAHLDAQARLRAVVSGAVAAAWSGLGAYDEEYVEPFLAAAVPLVLAGQRQSVNLTNGYLARILERDPFPLDADDLIAGLRGGVDPREVYRRPFVTLWSTLKGSDGSAEVYTTAVSKGLERLTGTAEMDVQMASRSTYQAVQDADEGIYGYVRVANAGACPFCAEVDGAYVKSAWAMPLHNRCGCGLEPLTAPHRRAASLPDGTAVHRHGELGPVLGDPSHDFTSQSDVN